MPSKFKVISSNSLELFQERLNRFIESLSLDDVVVDIKFATTAFGETVEYSALVHYQHTESWSER